MTVTVSACFKGLDKRRAKLLRDLILGIAKLVERRCGPEAVDAVFRAAAAVAICNAKPGRERDCLERGAMLLRLIAQQHLLEEEQGPPSGTVLQ